MRDGTRTRRTVLSDVHPLDVVERIHAEKVGRIAAQLAARRSTRPLSLRKHVVSHQVPKAGDKKHTDDKIDVGDLNRILHVDPARRTCVAEPGVTFVDLVDVTLRHGLVPVVVPELMTITIGGAVAGCSLESMSFRYGGFHDGCTAYEVVTASGEVLRCSPHENPLVFQMMHGSFGTLGVLSKLELVLVPAKPYVQVDYETYRSTREYLAAIRRRFERPDCDFLDGIIHRPERLVLCVGRFVDSAPYTHKYDWTRVYYQSTARRQVDYLHTADYFFRYDRGVTNPFPKSLLGRLLFGKIVSSDVLLRIAEKLRFFLDPENPTITLDTFVPHKRAAEFFDWYEATFGFYPLWCVPYRKVRDYEWLSAGFCEKNADEELFLDVAIYGMKQTGGKNYHRIMEQRLLELGGIKTLISHNYYDEDEFWSVWNRDNYAAAKAITDPNNVFRDLYTKTCRAARGLSER